MPVTSLINDMMYQLDTRKEIHDELSKDPSINPDWLTRSKAEMIAIGECVRILLKIKTNWRSKEPLRKRLKTPTMTKEQQSENDSMN
jgi:hypothetical protein